MAVIPIFMIRITFGLAMDYEFFFSRVSPVAVAAGMKKVAKPCKFGLLPTAPLPVCSEWIAGIQTRR